MKVKISGIEVEGTPEEIAKLKELLAELTVDKFPEWDYVSPYTYPVSPIIPTPLYTNPIWCGGYSSSANTQHSKKDLSIQTWN
ncbi:hypothetical protein SAMN04487895_101757 [Paenibacillus sophorae]|uniref:Uncharacterized protein n=1 Tax=Paenibacillus sophorae TaxID=1333845 RepID=A0A1H8H4T2_9BACL|nr:hypothetical protein [Paenibacillus sophorae]QWU14445.1 hypothetical protein KP014_21290 [Paenibacillus sophorae]SEN51263.1 hypothetical protein SAMN04487895_101757 [Paenibacillus sophorae]